MLALGQADELAERVRSKGSRQVILTMKALFDRLYAELDVEPDPAEHENASSESAVPESVEIAAVVENGDGKTDEDTEMLL